MELEVGLEKGICLASGKVLCGRLPVTVMCRRDDGVRSQRTVPIERVFRRILAANHKPTTRPLPEKLEKVVPMGIP